MQPLEIVLYLYQVFIKFVTVHVSCGNLIDIDKDGIDKLLSQMFMENGNVVTVCEMLGFSSLGHDVTNIGYLSLGFKYGFPNLIDHQIRKDRGKERTRT